jgi:hypothetical protein
MMTKMMQDISPGAAAEGAWLTVGFSGQFSSALWSEPALHNALAVMLENSGNGIGIIDRDQA